MLSNTAERTPKPNVLIVDGAGSRSTGISEASATNATRNSAPFSASRRMPQSGLRIGAVTSSAVQRPSPNAGTCSSTPGKTIFVVTFVATSVASAASTMMRRDQSIRTVAADAIDNGDRASCEISASGANTANAPSEPINAGRRSNGLMPLIHIIVVVV